MNTVGLVGGLIVAVIIIVFLAYGSHSKDNNKEENEDKQ